MEDIFSACNTRPFVLLKWDNRSLGRAQKLPLLEMIEDLHNASLSSIQWENNKQAWGGDGEIDRRAVLITQPTEAHFTGSVLYAHLCLWNCNRLFQLHARLDHGVVTIDVLLWVNLCKNHSSCKWCIKLLFQTISFFISHCSLKHCSITASALDYGGKYRDNKA